MSYGLTDKIMVVVSRLGDFWVTLDRAEKIMQIKEHDPNGTVEIDGSMISSYAIDGVISPLQYETLNKRRRGAWQCKFRWWHERNQQCAHQKYNPID